MNHEFLVLIDCEGIIRPMAFITRNDDIGKERAKNYKLGEGEKIVGCEILI